MDLTLAFGFGNPVEISILFVFLFVFLLLPTVFWIIELVDAARRQFPDSSTKVLWLLVILLTHFVGALIYYFVGKKQGTLV